MAEIIRKDESVLTSSERAKLDRTLEKLEYGTCRQLVLCLFHRRANYYHSRCMSCSKYVRIKIINPQDLT